MSDTRGPYHSFTASMTPAERSEWWKAQGVLAWEDRNKGYTHGNRHQVVTTRFRCAGYAAQAGQRAPKEEHDEWYKRGGLTTVREWEI